MTRQRAGGVAATPATLRLSWPDVAKGCCIVLVVLHHIVSKHLPAVLPEGSVLLVAWQGFDGVFKPMRMPLFFLLSGLFAASAVRRPWREVLGRRVLSPYWLYLLWLGIQVPVLLCADRIGTHRVHGWAEFAANLVFASTGLWYLYGLAAYFVAAKLLHRVPPWLVVSVAAAVSVSTSWLPLGGVNRASVLQCFVYFVVGAYLPQLLGRFRLLPGPAVVGVAGLYGAVAAAAYAFGAPRSVLLFLLAPAAIVLGAQLAMRLDGRSVGGLLARLGRRTLPVYVLHMPLLAVVHQVFADPLARWVVASGVWGVPAAVLYPVGLTVALVAACLAVQSGVSRAGMSWWFQAPSWLTSLPERATSAAAGPAVPAGAREGSAAA